jgi:DNA invertase Pin-like site-specific DNA recombinase
MLAATNDRNRSFLVDVDQGLVDAPRHARRHQPKPSTETVSHLNRAATVFGMTSIGYARVSTRDQDPAAQQRELEAAGCTKVFVDHGESSRVRDRPAWVSCSAYLRPGDTLVVRALDRVAGSSTMAIETISQLQERGVNIKSLTEPDIDTTTPMGRALFGIVAVFAQLRVDTIRDNTRRGLEHARAQGRVGGPTVMTPERVAAAVSMRREDPPRSIAHIAKVLGVGASSVARALARDDQLASS